MQCFKYVIILSLSFTCCVFRAFLFADMSNATSSARWSREYNLYYGNFHSHSKYSPVDLYTIIPPVIESLIGHPREAFAYARDSAGIDILAITDHTHPTTPLVGGPYYLPEYWDSTRIAADDATISGSFLALAGFEWSSISYGHINAFYTDDFRFTYTTDNLDSIYRWLSLRPNGIGQFNHPTPANFNSFRYRSNIDSSIALFEMQNTDEANRYHIALDSGWHVGMVSNQDNHVFQTHGGIKWGAGNQLTGVWADSLTRNSIYSALRHMRTFGTLDRNFSLKFTANDSWMGSTIPNGNIQFRITANDADSTDLINRIDLVTNNGVILDSFINVNSNSITWQKDIVTGSNDNKYFFARVIENDGNYIVTSAIWTSADLAMSELPATLINPTHFVLENNYPNPFISQTFIKYTIPSDCQVNLRIYNSSGAFVRDLKTENEKRGFYRVMWNGCDNKGQRLVNGIYFYHLEAGEYTAMKKMVMMK